MVTDPATVDLEVLVFNMALLTDTVLLMEQNILAREPFIKRCTGLMV